MRLPVPHLKQTQQADCLAACAAMVLAYLNQPTDYRRLLTLLGIGVHGAPRRNIVRLSRWGLDVVYREGNFSLLVAALHQGDPVIAFVDTGELSYWTAETNHAVVVVGIEGDFVLVNDPAIDEPAKAVPSDEFELAWLNIDYACAVVRRIST
jgi:ABC-type bacteriocin/lantibiotic exporter with double-glycine peptidase domain